MTTVAPLSRLDEARRIIQKQGATFTEVIRAAGAAFAPPPVRSEMPVPKQVTDSQREAVGKLMSVIGSVAPTERRELDPGEQRSLIEERMVLSEVEKLVSQRKEDIADIAHVHLDMEAVRMGTATEETPVHPKRGFFILPGSISVPGLKKVLKREVREGSASLPMSTLQAMEASGEITHEDFLAVTEPKREFSEHKFMLWLKKHPEKLADVGRRVVYSGRTAAVVPR